MARYSPPGGGSSATAAEVRSVTRQLKKLVITVDRLEASIEAHRVRHNLLVKELNAYWDRVEL